MKNGGSVACVSRDSIVGERAASTLQIPSIADKGNSIPLAFLCAVRDFSYVRERPIQPSGLLLDRAMREANLFDYSRNGEPSAFYSTGDS